MSELRTNPEQWEAFTHEGHCVVLAPPGSGKTKLLTTKAVWLANNDVQPGRGIACITLTNPAAATLRTRIRSLGQPVGRTVVVGTVHSFAWSQIIRPFAGPAGYPEWSRYKLAPDLVAKGAMRKSIDAVYGGLSDTRFVDSTVRRSRKMCLTEQQWASAGPKIQQVALEYERLLREHDYVDFDDVVAMAVLLVEDHPFVRTVLHARFPHLPVDEYQDLAPGLHRIVKSVSLDGGSSRLFAVGDPDQAIYGWTGTRPELLIELAQNESVHRVDLRINYRCGALIAAASRRILADQAEPASMRSGGSVSVICEPDGFDAQAKYIAARIGELRSAGAPLHEIAVLAPTNADCDQLVEVLREAGIPVAWRTDVYPQTPLTLILEEFAAWSACGGESTGYKLGDLLDPWYQLGDPAAWRRTATEVVEALMAASPEESATSFLEAMVSVVSRAGLLADVRSDDSNALERMRAGLAHGALDHLTVADLGQLRLRHGRVEVSTMSASKGLEFDHVFIAGLEEGKLPFYSSTRESAAWAEDRRKFYVSFTRARASVEVTYSGWYVTPWGSVKRNGPSAFLIEAGMVGATT